MKGPNLTLVQREAKKHEKAGEMTIETMSDVVPTNISWLWREKIAYGKMTIFAGEPGVGKSQLLLYIASIVSLGGRFHGENRLCDKNRVLLISGEDSASDTIKPRLMALGADLSCIDSVKGIQSFDASENEYFTPICIVANIGDLEVKIKSNHYKLIIIDPISLYLGSIDESKNKEIRGALGMLNALAERHGVAIILNSHFTKPSNNSSKSAAIYRVMGSIGFVAAARMAFGIMKDDEDETKRVFIPIKNNIGKDAGGLIFSIKSVLTNGFETSKVEWSNETSNKTANDLLNGQTDKPTPKLEEAKTLIIGMLQNGSVPLADIRKAFDQSGISPDRMYAAKIALKIYENESFSGRRGKIWSLPAE